MSVIRAYIGLGTNVGDRAAHLSAAVAALSATPGIRVVAVSPIRETSPVGGPPSQGAFLNAAASLDTTLTAEQLLATLHRIEAGAGRLRTVRWGERTLDLDLLLLGNEVRSGPDLVLPHPRMTVRRFVLYPLAAIAPEAVEPVTGLTVGALLQNLDRRPSHVSVLAPAGPTRDQTLARLSQALGGDWLFSLWKESEQATAPGPPTFVASVRPSVVGRSEVPVVPIEPGGPESIAAEILAACAATREG